MKTAITAQQTAFFTKHGFIEFEIEHPPLTPTEGRDLWRHNAALRSFLLRKVGPLALTLSRKTQLRLGCDQWIAKADLPKEGGKLKELLSLQGLEVGIILADHPHVPKKRSPLGILPLPSTANHVLFFRPDLILDWPAVTCDLYIAVFTLTNAVYIHNPNDPFTHALKAFGYQFGDVLKNEHHPLLIG